MKPLSTIASAIAIAILSGCAQTPAQVSATDPVRTIVLNAPAARIAKCLPTRLENAHGGWVVTTREDAGRINIRVHGGQDAGTVAIITFHHQSAAIHISQNVFTKEYFADNLQAEISACDIH